MSVWFLEIKALPGHPSLSFAQYCRKPRLISKIHWTLTPLNFEYNLFLLAVGIIVRYSATKDILVSIEENLRENPPNIQFPSLNFAQPSGTFIWESIGSLTVLLPTDLGLEPQQLASLHTSQGQCTGDSPPGFLILQRWPAEMGLLNLPHVFVNKFPTQIFKWLSLTAVHKSHDLHLHCWAHQPY